MSLQANIEKGVKQNLQARQNIIQQSDVLKAAQHNMLVFLPQNFLAVYLSSSCSLPHKIQLPEQIDVNWNYQYNTFGLAVLSVFKWCSLNADRASMSLFQFSTIAAKICDLILVKQQEFVQLLNTLFSAYRYFDVMAQIAP